MANSLLSEVVLSSLIKMEHWKPFTDIYEEDDDQSLTIHRHPKHHDNGRRRLELSAIRPAQLLNYRHNPRLHRHPHFRSHWRRSHGPRAIWHHNILPLLLDLPQNIHPLLIALAIHRSCSKKENQ